MILEIPEFLSYTFSFILIATMWFNHIYSQIPASIYASNTIMYNISFGILREVVIRKTNRKNPERKLELASLVVNGLTINVLMWMIPHFFN